MLQLAAAASPLLEMAKSLPMDESPEKEKAPKVDAAKEDPQQKTVDAEKPEVAGPNGELADGRASAVEETTRVTTAAAETEGKASAEATPKAKSDAARKRLASKTPDASEKKQAK